MEGHYKMVIVQAHVIYMDVSQFAYPRVYIVLDVYTEITSS